MAAIEYGSYYWCVVLNGKDRDTPRESVHLHADSVAVDPTGTLVFKSAGRRAAGTEPEQQSEKKEEKKSASSEKDGKGEKDGGEGKSKNGGGEVVVEGDGDFMFWRFGLGLGKANPWGENGGGDGGGEDEDRYGCVGASGLMCGVWAQAPFFEGHGCGTGLCCAGL